MTIIRRFEGIGIADNTTLTTSSAGTGDNTFDVVNATPTIRTDYANEIHISNAAEVDHVQWSGLTLTTWATHMYVRFLANAPTAASNFLYVMDSGGSLLWSLSTSATGLVQFRNNAATATASSPVVVADTLYRITCSGTSGSATINVTMVDAITRASFWAPTGQAAGTTTAPARFRYGRQSATLYGCTLRMSHLAIADVTGDLATLTGSAGLTGSGTLTGAGTPAIPGASSLTGSGALTGSGTPALATSLARTGSGTLGATGTPAIVGTRTPTGSGALTLSGVAAFADTLTLGGSGSLVLDGTPAVDAALGLTGSGQLTLSGVAVVDSPPLPTVLTVTPIPQAALTVTATTPGLTVTALTPALTLEPL